MDHPSPDYPAAHSMDTEWYAVDRDGHVALFESGEAGAMPIGAHTENETPRDDLAELVPEPPYRLLDWLGEETQEHHLDLPSPASARSLGPTLLFLRSVETVRAEVDEYLLAQAPASEGVAVLFSNLPASTAWRLHEAGACLGCFVWTGEGGFLDLYHDLPRRLGLFYYQHDPKAENWISGPYLRKAPPGHPLRIDQLPTEIREAIGKVRFADLSFSETESLQPIAFLPCDSCQSNYLDADGVTARPFPGREPDPDPEDSWEFSEPFIDLPPGQDPPPC